METPFNIRDLFANAFGYEAPQSFELPDAPQRKELSALGQPFYDTDDLGREFFMPVRINGVLIPFAVVSINCKKTLVETPMPERGGSVTEMISIDDYVINVKGILISASNDFPEADIQAIQDLFKINASVPMRSALTDIFLRGDIDNSGQFNHQVIIKEVKWPPTAGVQHAKAFDMDLKSDMIFTLTID